MISKNTTYMEDGNGVGVGNGVNVGIGVTEAIGKGADIEGVGVDKGSGVVDWAGPGEARALGANIDVSLQAISVSAARVAINIFIIRIPSIVKPLTQRSIRLPGGD
jgi:hypothetical protein